MAFAKKELCPEEELLAFVSIWWAKRGTRVSRVSQLLELARNTDFLPTLFANTHGHNTITTFGQALTTNVGIVVKVGDREVKVFKSISQRTRSGRYWLEDIQGSSEEKKQPLKIPKKASGKLLDLPEIGKELQDEEGQTFFEDELTIDTVPKPVRTVSPLEVHGFSFNVGDVEISISEKPTGKEILIKIPGDTK